MTFHLSNGIQDLDQLIQRNHGRLILLDFHATWCGPCKQIAPALEQIAHTQQIILAKIDVDDDGNKDLVDEFKITAMPTLAWIKNGKVLKTLKGANINEIQRITNELAGF